MTALGDLIKTKRDAKKLTQGELAAASGYGQSAIDAIENGKVGGPRRWHGLADALDIPREEFRQVMLATTAELRLARVNRDLHELAPERPNARLLGPSHNTTRSIPVFGQAVGGAFGEYIFNGEPVDYIGCPPSLENVVDAYAVFVDGDSMSPRYDSGDVVCVHPSKPSRPGDDVVVQISVGEDGPPHGYIKKFVGWTGSKLKLRQLNPDREVTFDRARVVSVHTIVSVERG